MKTWVIVLIVVVAVIVIVAVALALARRSRAGQIRKQEQARQHLEEAHIRGARADQEQALAEEQAARARRERAEVQERTALAEQEARERAARAGEEHAAAADLRAKAEKLAPDVAADGYRHRAPENFGNQDDATTTGTADTREYPRTTADPDYPEGGGSTRR